MTASIPAAAELIAANPGPGAHIALLGAVVVIGLIVFAVVHIRRKREAAEAERIDQSTDIGQRASGQSDRTPRQAIGTPGQAIGKAASGAW